MYVFVHCLSSSSANTLPTSSNFTTISRYNNTQLHDATQQATTTRRTTVRCSTPCGLKGHSNTTQGPANPCSTRLPARWPAIHHTTSTCTARPSLNNTLHCTQRHIQHRTVPTNLLCSSQRHFFFGRPCHPLISHPTRQDQVQPRGDDRD